MLYYYTRPALLSVTAWSLLSTSVMAEPPRVVTDIPPVQSLAAMVMDGVGTPEVIVPTNASPHGFSMRPSQALALEKADLIFWMGHELTPWLEKSLDNLSQDAEIITLLDAEGTQTYAFRSIEEFATGDKHSEHEEHDADAHDEHKDHDEHAKHEEHADHDDHEEHGEHKTKHDDHDHDHAHDHDGIDPHAWLDPLNAITWVELIAKQVSAADPENAATYERNASAAIADIRGAITQIEAKLKPSEGQNFIVFHDAYQYFETRFGLRADGSISIGDASQPSPARLSQIRETLSEKNVTCVFTEAQFNSGLVETVIEGTSVRSAQIDPIGATQTLGPSLYLGVLNGLADQFATCLKP